MGINVILRLTNYDYRFILMISYTTGRVDRRE